MGEGRSQQLAGDVQRKPGDAPALWVTSQSADLQNRMSCLHGRFSFVRLWHCEGFLFEKKQNPKKQNKNRTSLSAGRGLTRKKKSVAL